MSHLMPHVFWYLGGVQIVPMRFSIFFPLRAGFFCSSVTGEPFHFSYLCSCIASVIASTDMSFFLIFFFNSLSPVDFLIRERNFEASSSAAVIVSTSHCFDFQIAVDSPFSLLMLDVSLLCKMKAKQRT